MRYSKHSTSPSFNNSRFIIWLIRPLILILLTTAFILISSTYSHSQEGTCGSNLYYQKQMNENPDFKQYRDELEDFTRSFENANPRGQRAAKKIIPVVVHVIHNYGTENINKTQIESAIAMINKDFSKANSDLSLIVNDFKSRIGDTGIEFRLANLDPNGKCTEGITRTVSYTTINADESVKNMVNWNTSGSLKYLQIWVVGYMKDINGWATFPGGNPKYEGIMIRNTQFGSIGTSTSKKGRTLTHELGHFLNLYHIWGNTQVESNSNCNTDDNVGDTPNTVGHLVNSTFLTCDLSAESCGSLDNVQNFMDYGKPCRLMFTNGQVSRLTAAMNSSSRKNLWSSANLNATGTYDGFTPGTCKPVAEFVVLNKDMCAGAEIKFKDLSFNSDVDESWKWNWTFPGGAPSSSTEQFPTVSYSNTGSFGATLLVTNGSGSDQITKNNLFDVRPQGNGLVGPFSEGFEKTSFPNNTGNKLKDWTVESLTSVTWERNTASSKTGSASLRIKNQSIVEGSPSSIISPSIDIRKISSDLKLTFKMAYAKKSEDSDERLKVYVSKNCGQSWIQRYTKTADKLVTNGGNPQAGNFIPTASQWREETVNLGAFINDDFLRIKFEITSGAGNYLYIDDINLSGLVSNEQHAYLYESFKVFPNPTSGKVRVSYGKSLENLTLTVYNVLGQPVMSTTNFKNQTSNLEVDLSEKEPGVYLFELKSEHFKSLKRVIYSN